MINVYNKRDDNFLRMVLCLTYQLGPNDVSLTLLSFQMYRMYYGKMLFLKNEFNIYKNFTENCTICY